jgi:flagellar FliL protein
MADDETTEEAIEEIEEKPKKGSVPWIPLVLVLLFIPIITLVLVEFVVIPKLRGSLEHSGGDTAQVAHAAPAEDAGGGHGGGHGGGGDPEPVAAQGTTVVYEDVVSNVAGTMGTRFLKVSFQIVSEDPQLAGIARMREAQVRDAIITTLSSRTIQEIEVVGGRNALRVALIGSINEALGVNLVEELYFLDFIIQ